MIASIPVSSAVSAKSHVVTRTDPVTQLMEDTIKKVEVLKALRLQIHMLSEELNQKK